MKKTLIIFMTVMTVKLHATVYPVVCGLTFTNNVTCYVGDTVRFENHANQNIMISLKLIDNTIVFVKPDGTTTSSTTNPPVLTPDGNGKLVDYVVQGNEKEYSPANQIGTFTILTNTNVATGIDNLTNVEATIKAFPNPFVEELTVFSPVESVATIFDANGGQIISTKILSGNNKIGIQSLHSGIYWVRIRNKSIRIVKE